ncbi:MAG TPA: RidA family protein [Stellaceae bacterium]|nr:RidA family protein [Stellaceae bacterium]
MPQQVINLKGIDHPQASPLACKIGPLLCSGAIYGRDPESGVLPEGAEAQARNTFANMKRVLAAAGMSVDDVAKLTIYLVDDAHREAAFAEWAKVWPDPQRRPARRTLVSPIHAGIVQVEIIAYKA